MYGVLIFLYNLSVRQQLDQVESNGVRCGIPIISLVCYILSYSSQETGLLVHITSLPAYIPLHLAPVNWITFTRSGGVKHLQWNISRS